MNIGERYLLAILMINMIEEQPPEDIPVLNYLNCQCVILHGKGNIIANGIQVANQLALNRQIILSHLNWSM